MNYRRLNSISTFFFGAIIAMGGVYTALIGWIFVKTIPGLMMFTLYFFDSLKRGYSLTDLGAYNQLLSATGLWILSVLLMIKLVFSVAETIRIILKTRGFVKGLKIISKKGIKFVFNSKQGDIFTAGMFRPKIYMSSELLSMHTQDEVRAMVAHERRHVQAKDPLRTMMVSMIGNAIPSFPKKEKIIRNFYTLMEICADRMAEEKMEDKMPVVMALYKRLNMAPGLSAGMNFFNAQSERIHVLVGKKRLHNRGVISLVSFVVLVLMLGTYSVIKTNFYNCPHLQLCVSALTSVLELH